MPLRALRAAALAGLVALACSSGAVGAPSRPTAGPPAPAVQLPEGFHSYDGGDLGFAIGLAPGWTPGVNDAQGISFSDPAMQAVMLVHFESAQATDLDVASAQAMVQLTGGAPGARPAVADARLAGVPARRVAATYTLVARTQRVESLVMLEGGRAWTVALVGPPDAFDTDHADFDRMAATFTLSASRRAPPARAALGLPAPLFSLDGPGGRVVLSRFSGPVVVNFFASWCGPCRQEMPLLARAAESGHRFAVIGIDTHDDAAAVPGFLKELGVTFPVGYDTSGDVSDAYQLPGVPGTFFLDAGHVLRRSVVGPLSSESLQQGLSAIGTG